VDCTEPDGAEPRNSLGAPFSALPCSCASETGIRAPHRRHGDQVRARWIVGVAAARLPPESSIPLLHPLPAAGELSTQPLRILAGNRLHRDRHAEHHRRRQRHLHSVRDLHCRVPYRIHRASRAWQRQQRSPLHIDESCIACGHCGAVCVVGAVRSLEGEFPRWQAPAIGRDAARAFLAGRRSVRCFKPVEIERELLADVVGIAAYAPTASNAQDVSATIVTGDRVFELASLVNDYYRWLESLLKRWYLWPVLWFTAARGYLKRPAHVATIRERVQRFDRDHDWLFFGAPAVVVLSAPRRHRMFGRTNCTIAAERVMQYAAAVGLGSCWIGFAEVAIERRRSIAQAMGIPEHLRPHAVFVLGQPAVEYRRLPARRPLPVSWVGASIAGGVAKNAKALAPGGLRRRFQWDDVCGNDTPTSASSLRETV